jgi:hypothetical protein
MSYMSNTFETPSVFTAPNGGLAITRFGEGVGERSLARLIDGDHLMDGRRTAAAMP